MGLSRDFFVIEATMHGIWRELATWWSRSWSSDLVMEVRSGSYDVCTASASAATFSIANCSFCVGRLHFICFESFCISVVCCVHLVSNSDRSVSDLGLLGAAFLNFRSGLSVILQ